MYRWVVILGASLACAYALHGAQLIVNGDFETDLNGWATNGSVSQSNGFALIGESALTSNSAIFQTVGSSGSPLFLSFDLFIGGMSPEVPAGVLPDTAFGTLYVGDLVFGSDASAGTFDASFGLFDLDHNGLTHVAGSVVVTDLSTRPGWVRMTTLIDTPYSFATFVVEEVNLNAVPGDSVVALDTVSLEVIPEPATPWLLSFVIIAFAARRTRPT